MAAALLVGIAVVLRAWPPLLVGGMMMEAAFWRTRHRSGAHALLLAQEHLLIGLSMLLLPDGYSGGLVGAPSSFTGRVGLALLEMAGMTSIGYAYVVLARDVKWSWPPRYAMAVALLLVAGGVAWFTTRLVGPLLGGGLALTGVWLFRQTLGGQCHQWTLTGSGFEQGVLGSAGVLSGLIFLSLGGNQLAAAGFALGVVATAMLTEGLGRRGG